MYESYPCLSITLAMTNSLEKGLIELFDLPPSLSRLPLRFLPIAIGFCQHLYSVRANCDCGGEKLLKCSLSNTGNATFDLSARG